MQLALRQCQVQWSSCNGCEAVHLLLHVVWTLCYTVAQLAELPNRQAKPTAGGIDTSCSDVCLNLHCLTYFAIWWPLHIVPIWPHCMSRECNKSASWLVNKLCTGCIPHQILHRKQSGVMSLQKLNRLPATQYKWLRPKMTATILENVISGLASMHWMDKLYITHFIDLAVSYPAWAELWDTQLLPVRQEQPLKAVGPQCVLGMAHANLEISTHRMLLSDGTAPGDCSGYALWVPVTQLVLWCPPPAHMTKQPMCIEQQLRGPTTSF